MPDEVQRDILGPANPKDLQDRILPLYVCDGVVHGIAEFAAAYLDLLAPPEADLVRGSTEGLASAASIPPALTTCLTRSVELRTADEPHLLACRSGARSAFWEEKHVKFKGCRPVLDGADFPVEALAFGTCEIQHARIPFGVMRAEGIMREILGYCFLRLHGLPIHFTPLCVYEYHSGTRTLGFCLVGETIGEVRIEQFVDYPDRTIEDIIHAQSSGGREDGGLVGSELNLKGLNLWWYVEQKALLLSRMHFLGGLRGILNSNIGNDVIVGHDSGAPRLCLCDYDTFSIVSVPPDAGQVFLAAFALQCLVEVAKGSLSILEYVDLPPNASASQRAEALGAVYFHKSSLWRAYERRFLESAKRRGWAVEAVPAAFEEARHAEAFADALSGCVLNRHYVARMAAARGVFYPHN